MRFSEAVERLAVLPDPLPPSAEALMPVLLDRDDRQAAPRRAPSPSSRAAAVLALLFPDAGGFARIVLIERTTGGTHHSGEVSFPGGKAEPGDADPAATALREATEEVALDALEAGVRVVGTLEPVWIPVSDFSVTPILAVAERRPVLTAAPSEVARIIEAPVAAFLPGAPITIVERTIGTWPVRYGAFDIDGLSVWGATARILSQLGAILEGGRR